MKSSAKFWLGIFTFLPLVLILLILGFFFTVFLDNIVMLEHSHNEFPIHFFQSLSWFIGMIIITALISLAIKIYYIVHTNNLETNDTNKKIMWTLLLIFFGTVASIVYYFVEIIPLKESN